MATTWTIQRSKRPGGWYYQAVGPNRRTVTLGYLSDAEAEWARENAAFWSTAAEGKLFALSPGEVRTALKRNPSEAAEAIVGFEEAAVHRLVDAGAYAEMTLEDFARTVWWPVRTREVSTNTDRTERTWAWPLIFAAIGAVKVRNLDTVRWSRFMATLDHLSGSGRVKIQNAYRAALKYALEIGAIEKVHTFRAIKDSGKPSTPPAEALTVAEVAKLIDHAATPMHRALFAVAFGLGLRPAEAARVRWEDVRWAAGTLMVRGTKTSSSAALVPLTSGARTELERFWRECGCPEEGPAFLWHGKPFIVWEMALHKSLKRAGLYLDAKGNRRKITPYSGRYTFATLSVVAGVPDAAVRKAMRHTHKSTVLERTYQRLNPTQVVEAFASFPSFEPPAKG